MNYGPETEVRNYREEHPVVVPRPNLNKIREISIQELNKGYLVRVDCHSFAIESPETLIAKLSEYIKQPDNTETKWFNNQLF